MIYCVLPVLLFAAELYLRKRIREKTAAENMRNTGKENDAAQNRGFMKTVRIVPAFNRGFAGNRLENRPGIVKAASCICLAVYAVLYPFFLLFGESVLLKTGMSMVLGGAAGNTYERLRYGYVTDYLQFGKRQKAGGRRGGMIWNAADLAILSGTVLMLAGVLRRR